MIEVALNDEVSGRMMLSFDGRVLEIFGEGPLHMSRFHVGLLVVTIEGSDRKGRTQVDFAPVKAGRNGVRLILEIQARQAIEPLLVEVGRALERLPRPPS